MDKPAFLEQIQTFLPEGDWFDAFMVAVGMTPTPSLNTCKLASQRLSNLSRRGHLERRRVQPSGRARALYEYRRVSPPRQAHHYPAWVPVGIG